MVHWHTDYNGQESMHKCERDALESLRGCGLPVKNWAQLCADGYTSWGDNYASIEECDCPDCFLHGYELADSSCFSDADSGL